MLPLLSVITPKLSKSARMLGGSANSVEDLLENVTHKNVVRKKVVEVPVHQSNIVLNSVPSKHKKDNMDKPEKLEKSPSKCSRKVVSKLQKENRELIDKFNELEELSVKKITKLKEKISSMQGMNGEIMRENNYLKEQYENLVQSYGDMKKYLEQNPKCRNCEESKSIIDKISSENNLLKKSNQNLSEDVNMLKTVIFRLNVQLERYQEKFRANNLKQSKSVNDAVLDSKSTAKEACHEIIFLDDHKDHSHTPISWGNVNAHTLGPLLDAYQDTIAEKESIIESYETELSNFTGKLKEVLEENEMLHKKLEEDDGCSAKLTKQLEDVKTELKSVKEQNDLLIKKCALKQDKIEEILKCYETKVEQLKRDYAVAHEQYFKCRNEVEGLKEKNKALIDAQEEFRTERQNYIPLSVHNASVSECKKWYEELKTQYENEKLKLKENIDNQSKVIEDLKEKISALQRVKSEMESKVQHLEKHIKKGESKYLELEHALNEVQLSRSATRKQLHKVMNFARDMVAEQETLLRALNERHLENKAVKKIGSVMATKMDSLKSQLKDVQKNAWMEFSTVEQKFLEQQDMIENLKKEHSEEVERLQKIIKQQEENNLLFKNFNPPLPTYFLFKDKHNNVA